MAYKILGFVVWQGGKWYLRRRVSGTALKAGLVALAAATIAGVVVAGKQQQSSD